MKTRHPEELTPERDDDDAGYARDHDALVGSHAELRRLSCARTA